MNVVFGESLSIACLLKCVSFIRLSTHLNFLDAIELLHSQALISVKHSSYYHNFQPFDCQNNVFNFNVTALKIYDIIECQILGNQSDTNTLFAVHVPNIKKMLLLSQVHN